MVAKVVSIINLKGGVGKSTLTMMLSEYISIVNHKRVLVIDFDSQANLTSAMVRQLEAQQLAKQGKTTYHLFHRFLSGEEPNVMDVISPSDKVSNISKLPNTVLDIVISTPDLARLDEDMLDAWEQPDAVVSALVKLANNSSNVERLLPGITQLVRGFNPSTEAYEISGIRYVLKTALQDALESYDLILIDCPPGLSLLTSAAIIASDYFVSPVIPEPLSILGIQLIQSRIANLRFRDSSVQVDFAGSILNKVIQVRNSHRTEASRMYGFRVGEFSSYDVNTYKPFKWWIPDAEHLRKLGDFECHLIPDIVQNPNRPGLFGWTHGKYGARNVRLNSSRHQGLDRSTTEGPQYYLSERLSKVASEFMDKVGL